MTLLIGIASDVCDPREDVRSDVSRVEVAQVPVGFDCRQRGVVVVVCRTSIESIAATNGGDRRRTSGVLGTDEGRGDRVAERSHVDLVPSKVALGFVEAEEDQSARVVESFVGEERDEPVLDPLRGVIDRGIMSLKGAWSQSRGLRWV